MGFAGQLKLVLWARVSNTPCFVKGFVGGWRRGRSRADAELVLLNGLLDPIPEAGLVEGDVELLLGCLIILSCLLEMAVQGGPRHHLGCTQWQLHRRGGETWDQ